MNIKMLKVFILVSFALNVLVGSTPLDESVIEEHVVGGNDTDISKVPYQVVVYSWNKFQCGGFIVSPTFVVTAGHCVKRIQNDQYTVRAGSTSRVEGGVVVKVKKVHRNPKYEEKTTDYDVAVLELETPLQINNKTIKPIKLTTKEPEPGQIVLVSGWGCINEEYDETIILQSVTFPIYNRTVCEVIYKLRKTKITPRMICAGAEGKTAYYGDSGGPLVYKDEAVGIVSFGSGCGKKDLPGVYANIANPEINKFIRDIVKL